MAFDRNAIAIGRRIQDFGLCDLKGAYQHSTRLRGKGFLVVAFVNPLESNSVAVVKRLQDWLALSDKVGVVVLTVGERDDAAKMIESTGVTYPVLWDFEAYTAMTWAVTAAPTIFIVNGQGLVLGRVLGNDKDELEAAKTMLLEEVRKLEEAAKAAADAAAAAAAAKK